MADFVAVAKMTEIPDPGKLLVEVGERLVVLIHAAGHFYALDDICTHDGGPLSEGPLDVGAWNDRLSAARSQVRYSNRRGLTMPATKPTRSHEVKVEGDQIFVRLSRRLDAAIRRGRIICADWRILPCLLLKTKYVKR